MVTDPAHYVWSSYQRHALGKAVKMSTPHEEYFALGVTEPLRQSAYRALIQYHVDGELIKDIRLAVNKGLALGDERFKDEIEQLYNRRVRQAKMGRPRLQSEEN
jgi:putative transposase